MASARKVREAGLRVSSLCRGGMFMAGGHILDFRIGGWLSPNGEPMMGRGMMG